jgi:5-formyltetrahydrofolate cyclo-ligase
MRRAIRAAQLSSDEANAALDRWLHAHPLVRTLAVYSALPGEVDFSAITQFRRDLRWVYPRICGDSLTFHVVPNSLTGFVPGTLGVKEPGPECPEIAIGEIDAFICPGLAFDDNGGRLGRGRGFYDRILVKARADALKVGACFNLQRVKDTFTEAHDVRMDHVIIG